MGEGRKIKIGIIGSRGIPNQYGGFEQFAEYLSAGLVKKGCRVWVYSPDNHPYKKKTFQGVGLIHCFNPENRTGPFGQLIYDLNCILDSRKRAFDIILQLGYTSSAVWNWLFDKNVMVVTNPDGMEWKRSKYNWLVRKFLKFSEKTVMSRSHCFVADSQVIKKYIQNSHKKDAWFIPYGADPFLNPRKEMLRRLGVTPHGYFLVIARLQPDNNTEMILQAVKEAGTAFPLVVVGRINNRFAKQLQKRYGPSGILFTGGIYDQEFLHNLRFFSLLYFHGHSAGGTNPSLLEAMAASSRICAHDNLFNKSVLGRDAFFFSDKNDIVRNLPRWISSGSWTERCENNLKKVETLYSKQQIIDQYHALFRQMMDNQKNHYSDQPLSSFFRMH